MTEPIPEKKGMSKGCLIGLIVAGVLIVIIGAVGVFLYMKRDSLMKFGVSSLVNEVRAEAIKLNDPEVDTVKVNRVADAFLEKFNAEEVNLEKMTVMGETVRKIIDDSQVDGEEINEFLDAMVDYYPELGDLIESSEGMMDMPGDSVEVIEESMEGTSGSE